MNTVRRLGASTPDDTFLKTRRGAIRYIDMTEDAFRALERDNPERIVVDGNAVLVAEQCSGRVELHYAFPDQASFSQQFSPMFARVAGLFSLKDAPFGINLRLTDRALRSYVEPALFAQAFAVTREWLRMELIEIPVADLTGSAVLAGYSLRPARADDVEAIVGLIHASFDNPSVNPRMWAEAIESGREVQVLEDPSGDLVGLLHVRPEDARSGYVSELAIHPDHQRRGLGEALMRRSFAWFREHGFKRAALTTSPENSPAIALYHKLGFTISQIGVDYGRSLDDDVVRQVLQRNSASHITIRRAFP